MMQAHIIDDGVIINTIEVESLDFLPGLLDASLGGVMGDHQVDGVFCKPIADLSKAKSLKNVQINQWREQANGSSFVFGGKHIAADDLSTKYILVTNAKILNRGGLPADWLGKWKAIDNTYVDILNIADWHDFIDAMYNQGQTNFIHSQQLKMALSVATTFEEVEAIKW